MSADTASIVVGVDGSEASLDALRWAVGQAQATGAALRAVTAWTFPEEPTPFGIVPDLPPRADELADVESKLAAAVEGVAGSGAGIEVTAEVVPGHAGPVLVEASHGAALLVVGNRGRGRVAETLLGSVSEHCVRHATCPVVVVRHPRRR